MITLTNAKENLTCDLQIATPDLPYQKAAFIQGLTDGYNEIIDGFDAEINGHGYIYIQGHEQGTQSLHTSRQVRQNYGNPPADTHHLPAISQRMINYKYRVMVDLELPESGLKPEDLRPYIEGARDGFAGIPMRAELCVIEDKNPNISYWKGYANGCRLLCEAIAAKNER